MMMFGGVPISVMVPPSREPNARGISSSEGDRPASLDIQTATGINSASAPTLLINPEQRATTEVSISTCSVGLCPTFPSSLARRSTTPPLTSPWLITRTAATVTTAGWPKPSNS